MEIKVNLKESDMPRQWYDLAADLPTPLPPPAINTPGRCKRINQQDRHVSKTQH
jgi:tryptophan synthase beta chain